MLNPARIKTFLLAVALSALGLGLASWMAGSPKLANVIWFVGVVPVLAALSLEIGRSLGRGEVGLDIVAALSMTAALTFGETLAASVVALMYSGGRFLEAYAEGRARSEMSALLSRVPRMATRYVDGTLVDVPLDAIEPGDRLFVRQGDVTPVDGTIDSERAFLDTSALTGESLPVKLSRGAEALSGSANAGNAFDMIATHRAKESTYAGIVRLVEQAERSTAPMSRLADRWSIAFLAGTVGLALVAWWFTADPIRAVAVLVVATPCPLILAVPVALVAGLSRAARFGVLIKGAKPLEAMGQIQTLILDKTGTLTDGRPKIVSIETFGEINETDLLRVAASLDQASKHPVAQAIVMSAKERGLNLPTPLAITEVPGEGVEGSVEGRQVAIGGLPFISGKIQNQRFDPPVAPAGAVLVSVAVEGRLAGHIVMADPLRDDVHSILSSLRREGINRILLATGDRAEVAERVTKGLGLDGLRAGLTPDQKVLLVLTEHKNGPVMMVGDGVNDAPALAAADVGVAMGARGAAASSEAADVVLLVDSLDRLLAGVEIARRSRTIAIESVAAGIGLSLIGMLAAAFGLLLPVQGALLQEAIDVAVILNALRALTIEPKGIIKNSLREKGAVAS